MNLPTPTSARVYGNLPEGISYHYHFNISLYTSYIIFSYHCISIDIYHCNTTSPTNSGIHLFHWYDGDDTDMILHVIDNITSSNPTSLWYRWMIYCDLPIEMGTYIKSPYFFFLVDFSHCSFFCWCQKVGDYLSHIWGRWITPDSPDWV